MHEPAPASRLSLVYVLGGRPRAFPLPDGATTIGRAADNDLVLADESVSPHQVVLMRDGEDVELRDLFAGETRVNDEVRRSGPLAPGDVLGLGALRLRLMRVAATRPAPVVAAAAEAPSPARPAAEDGEDSAEEADERALFDGRLPLGGAEDDDAEADLFAEPAAAAEELPEEEAAPEDEDDADDEGAARPDPSLGPRSPEEGGTARYVRTAPAPDPGLRRALEREARRARALARARQLSDDLTRHRDFDRSLEQVALAFLDVFAADRAVTILFEEDGRNPLLTVERRRDGGEDEGGVAQAIVERCLQVRSVLRIAGDQHGLDGLAAPLLAGERALGLLYFERTGGEQPIEPEDVHLMAILANQASLVIASQLEG